MDRDIKLIQFIKVFLAGSLAMDLLIYIKRLFAFYIKLLCCAKEFLSSSLMVETYKWYEFIFPESVVGQKAVLALWWLVLLYGLFYMVRAGARNTGASRSSLFHKNTEAVQQEIDEKGKQGDGTIDGVSVPAPVYVS